MSDPAQRPDLIGYTEVELRTKEIYIAQHKNYTKDESIFNRFLAFALDPATYDLPLAWFQGKSVLDAGCGNTGYLQVAMHRLGAKKITCLDLGTDWISELQKVMDRFSIPRDFVEYVEGSTTDLPFADNSFDLVISNGVVMHLESVQRAERALDELTRVTASGGCFYVYTGVDKPGIVDRYILPALRQAYAEDEEFRSFVDNIDPADVVRQLQECYSSGAQHDQEISKQLIAYLPRLFTLDSATFTQNALQVPMQQSPKLTETWARNYLTKLGLSNIRRVKERYWMRNDYRRFLAPIHFRLDLQLPRVLYGYGHVKMIAEKL